MMEQLAKHKEEMIAKKLAEQQAELLRDMNKKDVDQMLDKHKRELVQMDSVLEGEKSRQMDRMRDRLKARNEKAAKAKVERQLKMAEIQMRK